MDIKLEGSETLAAQLALLPDKVRKAVERKAMDEANKTVAAALRANVPKDTGALQKSISQVRRSYKGGNIVVGVVGANTAYTGYVTKNKKGKKVFKRSKKVAGNSGFRNPAKYSHLVEYGTKNRTTQGGANRGSVTATHFTEKTQQQVEAQVKAIFEKAAADAVNNL
jgi:HK97 gp10 family phage protein